jgi:hypothetical protein
MLRQLAPFLLAAILLPNVACLTFPDRPHPSDDELLLVFNAHEAEFDQLELMCREDAHMSRVAPDFTWKKDNVAWPRPESELGITKERWDEYRELFTKLGIRDGLGNYQPDEARLFVNDRGLVTGGSSKGYAYLYKPPKHLQNSLDNFDFKNSNADGETAYRHIRGNWYLYYDVS